MVRRSLISALAFPSASSSLEASTRYTSSASCPSDARASDIADGAILHFHLTARWQHGDITDFEAKHVAADIALLGVERRRQPP